MTKRFHVLVTLRDMRKKLLRDAIVSISRMQQSGATLQFDLPESRHNYSVRERPTDHPNDVLVVVIVDRRGR